MLAQQQPDELLAMGVKGQRLPPAECQRYSMLDSHRPPSESHDHLCVLWLLQCRTPHESIPYNASVIENIKVVPVL